MKYVSKDIYGPWDSPKTFCRYQVNFEGDELTCTHKMLDEQSGDKECKCPWKESDVEMIDQGVWIVGDGKIWCEEFELTKHDKNIDAKRAENEI